MCQYFKFSSMEDDKSVLILFLFWGCVVLLFVAFGLACESKQQSEDYKILEATYAADTTDRGNTERKLIEKLETIQNEH